ncbi:MAG: phage integrase N-terminal SAM-like domain-containing protein, partial [Brevinematia bacterium]
MEKATLFVLEKEIKLKISYNPEIIRSLKKLEQYYWDSKKKVWIFNKNDEVLRFIKSTLKENNIEFDEISMADIEFLDLKKHLLYRKYSERTVRLYLYYNKELLKFCRKKAEEITEEDIRNYLYYLGDVLKLSSQTLNVALNAIK